jgi:hypothetical protein
LKIVPDPHDFSSSRHFVKNDMPSLDKELKNLGFKISWDELHNVRIKAMGLSRDELLDKARTSRTKDSPYKYLMWLLVNQK